MVVVVVVSPATVGARSSEIRFDRPASIRVGSPWEYRFDTPAESEGGVSCRRKKLPERNRPAPRHDIVDSCVCVWVVFVFVAVVIVVNAIVIVAVVVIGGGVASSGDGKKQL